MSRPTWKRPSFVRLFTYDAIVTGVAVIGGLFVACFLLGFIAP